MKNDKFSKLKFILSRFRILRILRAGDNFQIKSRSISSRLIPRIIKRKEA